MVDSYEKNAKESIEHGKAPSSRLDIGIIKYFWQAGPYGRSGRENIPKFIRDIEVFRNFTDYELRILSTFFHKRTFVDKEVIFRQNDSGIGFYIIYSGTVEIIVERDQNTTNIKQELPEFGHVVTLEKHDCFGELALLQEQSIRSATAIAKDTCNLLGIFKPDLDELISVYPVVATKLLQSVSVIIAERLFSLTTEVRSLKNKIDQLEKKNVQENI